MTPNELKIETILMLEERISRLTEAEKYDLLFYHAAPGETLEEAYAGMERLGKKMLTFPLISNEDWLVKYVR